MILDYEKIIDTAIEEVRRWNPRAEITQEQVISLLLNLRVQLNGTCKQDLQVAKKGGER